MFGCELVLLAIGPRLFDHFSSSLPFEFRSLKKNKIKFQFSIFEFFSLVGFILLVRKFFCSLSPTHQAFRACDHLGKSIKGLGEK